MQIRSCTVSTDKKSTPIVYVINISKHQQQIVHFKNKLLCWLCSHQPPISFPEFNNKNINHLLGKNHTKQTENFGYTNLHNFHLSTKITIYPQTIIKLSPRSFNNAWRNVCLLFSFQTEKGILCKDISILYF